VSITVTMTVHATLTALIRRWECVVVHGRHAPSAQSDLVTSTLDTGAEPAITSGPPGCRVGVGEFTFTSTESRPRSMLVDGAVLRRGARARDVHGLSDAFHTLLVARRRPRRQPDPCGVFARGAWTRPARHRRSRRRRQGERSAQRRRDVRVHVERGPSTFACKIDGGAFVSCTSPTTFAGLSEASHTFSVRASDAAGNTDPTPPRSPGSSTP